MRSASTHVPRKDTTSLVCAVFIWEGYLGRLTPKVVDATLALSVGTAWLLSGRPAGPAELTRRSSPPFVRYASRAKSSSGSRDAVPIKAYCCRYVRSPPRVPRIQAVGDGSTDRHIRWPLRGICSHAVGTCSPAVQTAYMPKETGVPEVCTPVHSAHCLTFCRSLAAAGLRLFLGACSCPHPRAQKERGEIRSELFPGAASCAFPNAGFLSFAIIPFPLP
jgi:hypothetical protein